MVYNFQINVYMHVHRLVLGAHQRIGQQVRVGIALHGAIKVLQHLRVMVRTEVSPSLSA